MKNFKKSLALILVLVLVVSFFAGCKKEEKKTGVKEYDAFLFMTTEAYNPDMLVWKEAEKKTGIRLNGVVSEVATDPEAAYSTMLAGSKLPEVIRSNFDHMRELAEDGGLVPLDEYIDEYGPNIKKYFEKYVFYACKDVRFTLAELGNDAGIWGCVQLLLN